jgi:hypothetical protein
MKVPSKVCSRYVTRHWKERRARGDEKLSEFLMYFYARNESLPPTKIKAESLEPRTTLRLYYAHEKIEDQGSDAIHLQLPNDSASRRQKCNRMHCFVAVACERPRKISRNLEPGLYALPGVSGTN